MTSLENICDDLAKTSPYDNDLKDEIVEHIRKLIKDCNTEWNDYSTFLPPRLVSAFQKGKMACFLGRFINALLITKLGFTFEKLFGTKR